MLRPLLAAGSAALVLAPLALPAHAARAESRGYTATPTGIVLCGDQAPEASAGACFDVVPGETQVSVDVADAVAGDLTFEVQVLVPHPDGPGRPLLAVGDRDVPTSRRVEVGLRLLACGSVEGIALPGDAISVIVRPRDVAAQRIDDLAGNAGGCPAPTTPTTGTITATFT